MSLLKSASTVSLWTLASRITGLVRELLIASAFGASALTDAFNVAFRIPNLFRRLFAEGAFSQAFVPVLAASKAQNGEAATHMAINHVATLLGWTLLLLSILGVATAPFFGLGNGQWFETTTRIICSCRTNDALDVSLHCVHVIGCAISRYLEHLEAFCGACSDTSIAELGHDWCSLVGGTLV